MCGVVLKFSRHCVAIPFLTAYTAGTLWGVTPVHLFLSTLELNKQKNLSFYSMALQRTKNCQPNVLHICQKPISTLQITVFPLWINSWGEYTIAFNIQQWLTHTNTLAMWLVFGFGQSREDQERAGRGMRSSIHSLVFSLGESYHVYVIILILNILNALDTADHSVFEILSPVASAFSHFLGFVLSLAVLSQSLYSTFSHTSISGIPWGW